MASSDQIGADRRITCPICFHRCRLREGQVGVCRGRICRDGVIVARNYGDFCSLALDPIEKKPLYHFHPGSFILSAGTYGCNLRCPFCQNHELSMAGAELPTRHFAPEELTAIALKLSREAPGNLGVAFTYNEPLISYEYIRDCGRLLHDAGLYCVLVTNGTINTGPLEELLPVVDAMNIDLKGFTAEFYHYVGGDLAAVKACIRTAAKACHVEVTTLIIPGLNDNPAHMAAEARWLAEISPDLPLHISRFFPRHQVLDRPPTPVATIHALCAVAREHLHHVHPGNC